MCESTRLLGQSVVPLPAITAWGNRPIDHAQRDLLLASLLRDPRTPRFRRRALHAQGFDADSWNRIPESARPQARQLAVLAKMQATHLAKLRERSPFLGLDENRILSRLDGCVPVGAAFDVSAGGRPCGYPRLCPWCHARSITRLYRTVIHGPLAESRCGRLLLAGFLSVPVTAFRVSDERFQRLLWNHEQWFQQGSVINPYHALQRANVKLVRTQIGGWLRSTAQRLGMTGGAFVYQVGPYRDAGRNCFQHQLAVLGEVDGSSPDKITRLNECIGLAGGQPPSIDVGSETLSPACLHLPATPQNFRYLLFGTPWNFPVDRLGATYSPQLRLRNGLQGVAALPPYFMFDPVQFWSYFEATRGIRHWTLFGTWKGQRMAAAPASTPRRLPTESGRRGVLRRRRVLQTVNQQRRQSADQRREALLAAAQPVVRSLESQLGRPPGRRRLLRALASAGHSVSERDARWLVLRLQRGNGS
jgi:hypothetical protein